MQDLNLPTYEIRTKRTDKGTQIFDPIRKKFLVLTPEEWVRQNFLQFMIQDHGYPASLIRVEMALDVNKMTQRSDIVAFNNNGSPILIVECKSPKIKLGQKVFDQASRYNISLKVPYLMVTNGLNHYCCRIDFKLATFNFLTDIPNFAEVCNAN